MQIILAVTVFTGIIVLLSAFILLARSRLVETGTVHMVVNDDKDFEVQAGAKLLTALASVGLYLPAGCGGKGTCGQCRVKVLEGGGPLLPTEESLIGRHEAAQHVRLGCQVTVRENVRVRIPDEVFGVRKWECTVRSTGGLSTFIKEIVLELPTGEHVPFRAGGYVQVECPRYQAKFSDFDIEPEFREDWDRHNLWRFRAGTKSPTTRAYSMANYPEEKGIILLNIGIAIPPPGSKESVPPGVVSSYLFSLKPGDKVTIAGPYGEFYAKDTENEMVFIGGGTGMAPLRSHILDQLKRIKTDRKISFWFGVRSKRDMFYHEEFERLAAEHPNFNYVVSLSEPKKDDDWDGPVGFIHQVAYEQHLANHDAPEDCEYYMCGPPLMISAVQKMLTDLGVPQENVMFDDFGS
ncbi:MAG: NADH:ubiquinone reductase (Na(+)-transporting) subunit F [Deltaproteobacteria bacterium]|nr:NADH:ubiquinone reductase (Na(+)-transporting) subunit F [Deltaproteobacteria bacterium]MBW1875652.1 NADH:ubiquinone reductase (Na(+)-transporting) subunit F [Deltaproteobacteria bacterium]MBW2211402.1 NADH:ubiquinone reductase (Na(+)-transporting) subunit F [Deltaproteobacteria bacterium]MBW2213959.1 NADH:ubiquinone reductase (Na(+)-transporting) subunit F [Deltaproteobacteria bacterium]MBW2379509.1 NADH:ubiquinone reductase (Na(+)-transporting) subunit F [Deltaproteobacteria bacterium]